MLSVPARRGCGTRKAGGIYIDMGLVPEGTPGAMPVEHFYIDPPMRVTDDLAGDLGLKAIGVSLIEIEGTTHVLDWVGAQYYPNVADFCEEVKHFGLSRRCELATEEYAKLTQASTIILVHPKAWLNEYDELEADLLSRSIEWSCPKKKVEHEAHLTEMCAGLWWHDLVDVDGGGEESWAERQMPSFAYTGTETSATDSRTYTPAIFARFPIGQLVVVKDREGDKSERALKRLEGAGVPVYEVEE